MPKRSSKRTKKEHDFAINAFRVVQEATGQAEAQEAKPELSPEERHTAAVALGRLGGLKGGKARAKRLSAERRSEIAKKAASVRWAKR